VAQLWGLAALTLWSSAPSASAEENPGGLRTEFGEVRLQNLAIGKTYSVVRLAAAPLVIRNTSEESLRVHVQVVIPSHHELRSGALPLPEKRWVRLERADFVLPAGSTVRTDVRVTLPYDPDLAGKTFQVDLWSSDLDARGEPRGRVQVHRLLFNVEMDYRDDTEARFSLLAPRR
jgi:hypothetical protein